LVYFLTKGSVKAETGKRYLCWYLRRYIKTFLSVGGVDWKDTVD